MEAGDESRASAVAVRAFEASVAAHYSELGAEQFLRYAAPEELRARSDRNHRVILAESDGVIEGMVEVRSAKHIAMLFVEPARQRNGVGRALVELAVELCRERRSRLGAVTVNSSPNAVGAYLSFGFVVAGSERQRDGIIYTPMKLLL